MKLWAIADLHLRYEETREALDRELSARPEDWLIVAGDVGETAEHLRFAFERLTRRFARVLWVPGNHELWSTPNDPLAAQGEARYRRMVEIARSYGVVTPEDAYPVWPATPAGEPPIRIAPLFLLYDYSFHPDGAVPEKQAVQWAMEAEILCSDEVLLKSDPYPSRSAWCAARCRTTAERLAAATAAGERTVLINHFPLKRELARLPAVPRFVIWCGTQKTEDWHRRFRAEAVVYGHLHIPRSTVVDGVRFEEVSFGYPRNWQGRRRIDRSLRQILPAPEPTAGELLAEAEHRAEAGSDEPGEGD